MTRHPRITHAYDPRRGWVSVRRRLTPGTVEDLMAQQFTMVRVRHGLLGRREVSLRRVIRST